MTNDIFSADKVFKKSALINLGLCDKELTLPLILIFCEQGCESAVEHIKYGIISGGGAAAVVNMPSLSDMAADCWGKSSLLFSREAAADMTECMLNMYSADGAVIVAKSESAAAGMLMGAVRRNVPLVFLPAFFTGSYFPSRVRSIKAAVSCGKAGISELEQLQGSIDSGRTMEMDNLNSLCIFLEGCGLSIKNSVGTFSLNDKISCARQCGALAAKRASSLSYPRKDLNQESVTAGLAAYMASGGSTAALIHILAIIHENHMDFDVKDIEKLSEKTPLLARIAPLGGDSIVDFCKSGGTFAVLGQLTKIPKLIPSCTICGMMTDEIAAKSPILDNEIISPVSPANKESGFSVFKGSLFDYGYAKRGISDKNYKGDALVFDSEEQFRTAILSKGVKDGSVLVVRGQGAKDTGMPLLDLLSAVDAASLKNCVIITDGRAVEARCDCPIISLCSGGVMHILKSGDPIEVDFKKCKVVLNVAGKEISNRVKKFKDVDSAMTDGLNRYSKLVGEVNNGCILQQKF